MLLMGLADAAVSAHERRYLGADHVSGVILGAHNVQSCRQLQQLVRALRDVRVDDGFVVGMDRSVITHSPICDGFTRLPPLASLGRLRDVDRGRAVERAEEYAWLMACELRATDIDFALAPVLDLARSHDDADAPALHADPAAVAELGQAMVRGMRLAGMAAVPGHVPSAANRAGDEDLQPFVDAVASGAEALMLEHPAAPGSDVLRDRLGFHGLILAHEKALATTRDVTDLAARMRACHDAGCDLIPVCRPDMLEATLQAAADLPPCDPARVASLRGAIAATWDALVDNPQRDQFIVRVQALDGEPRS